MSSSEWTPLVNSLRILQFRDNGTSVELYSEFLDKSMILNPVNGSNSHECVLALKSLDEAEWEIGLDLADLRRFLYQEGVEVYFIRWLQFTPMHSKEIKDISAFLRKKKHKLKGVLFWINGHCNAGDMCALDENVGNIFPNCELFLQFGLWDAEPSVNAILVCEQMKT